MIKKEVAGQIKMSFGMIFSIILIIVFLVFAFYAIKIFLGIGDEAKTQKFISDFQSDINRIWISDGESSEEKEYSLPSKIPYVCFVDFDISATGNNAGFYKELKRAYYGSENMIFYPIGSSEVESAELKNINLDSIISYENPYCIDNDGKIILTLSKNYGEALVSVKR